MVWDWTLFSIALIALLVGWQLGYWQIKRKLQYDTGQVLSVEYFRGINYLLGEQPDRAVDIFIKNLEVTPETIETHLALGALFRRRGEGDRAIKIHQNLLSRPGLNRIQQENVQLELAKDYLSAGLLDRAERILLELVDLGGRNRKRALKHLVLIYEQLKDWDKSLAYGSMLLKSGDEGILLPLAHYACEIAENKIEAGDYTEALAQTKKALQYDRKCVRASILQAQIELKTERFKEAIKALRRVKQQDARWVGEIVGLMRDVHEKADLHEEYLQFLRQSLQEDPQVKLAVAMADIFDATEGYTAAHTYLRKYLNEYPSWSGLAELLAYKHSVTEEMSEIPEDSQELGLKPSEHGSEQGSYQDILHFLVKQWTERRANYICSDCGFNAHQCHWQCPSCKQWGCLQPAPDLSVSAPS